MKSFSLTSSSKAYLLIVASVIAFSYPAISSAESLGIGDLESMHSTYKANQIRFKRDYVGKSFVGRIAFRTVRESMFNDGEYTVEFGNGGFTSDVDCKVSDPSVIDKIVEWNKGDVINVSGVVADSLMGSIQLSGCSFVE